MRLPSFSSLLLDLQSSCPVFGFPCSHLVANLRSSCPVASLWSRTQAIRLQFWFAVLLPTSRGVPPLPSASRGIPSLPLSSWSSSRSVGPCVLPPGHPPEVSYSAPIGRSTLELLPFYSCPRTLVPDFSGILDHMVKLSDRFLLNCSILLRS